MRPSSTVNAAILLLNMQSSSTCRQSSDPLLHLRLLMLIAVMIITAGFPLLASLPEIPVNPNIADRRHYVADPAGIMPASAVAAANARLAEVRKATSCEVAAVVMPSIGDYTAPEFCEKVFTAWGLGKADKDNGVLLLIDTGGRQAFIMTGYGAEGVLPDISCAAIVNSTVAPAMRANDPGRALTSAVDKICMALTDPAAADELRSSQADNFGGADRVQAIDPENLFILARWVAALAFMLALAVFISDCVKSRRLSDNYERAMLWRRHMPTYWGAAVISLCTALIFPLLALWRYRSMRNRRVKCPSCGTLMKKLNEEEDNALLSPSQDLEERLGTIDYDVWQCPSCHATERFPFKLRQLTYSKCPACGTVAMRLKSDAILRPATTRSAGKGVKTYECLYCHHHDSRPYDIPRKEDHTGAAIAAGAALGALSGHGRRGGGFGGGFGGGATGGGGGGGRW